MRYSQFSSMTVAAAHASDEPPYVPLDIKLMNLAASLLLMTLIAGGIVAALWWAHRQPAFSITRVAIVGEVAHANAALVQAEMGEMLRGNFFTINPTELRNAFEQLPWVRRAQVSRQFPGGLRVQLQEHTPRARWGTGGIAMLNTLGEVFEAPIESHSADFRARLPQLAGPDGSASEVLAMFEQIGPVFAPIAPAVRALTWRDSGSWLVELEGGARIELGGGSQEEVIARAQRFVQLLPQAAQTWQRTAAALEYADLRYPEGFALRLRGVTTTASSN